MKKLMYAVCTALSFAAISALTACGKTGTKPAKPEQEPKAGQYTYSEIESVSLDKQRQFMFSADLNGWKAGSAGGAADSAEWLASGERKLPCVKLSGADVGEPDEFPNAWLYNKFRLSKDDKILYLNVSSSVAAPASLRVSAVCKEDEEYVSKVLTSTSDNLFADENGYYTLDNSTSCHVTFDLSAYLGKSVVISVEQNDSGDGGSLYIHEASIINEYDNISQYSEWDKTLMARDWDTRGTVEYTTDGVCLINQGEASSLLNQVTVCGKPYLKMYFNKYVNMAYNNNNAPEIMLFVDGTPLAPLKDKSDHATALTEEFELCCYDLTSYLNQIVNIEIKNEKSGGNACIKSIFFDDNKRDVLSKNTRWNIDDIATDWDLSGNVKQHTEGICLENYGKAASLFNYISVPTDMRYFKISFRKFVREGAQDRDPQISVYADGTLLKAENSDEYTVTVTTDAYEIFCYDFSEYTGKNITVEIVSKSGEHACFNEIYLDKSRSVDVSEQYTIDDIQNVAVSSERSFLFYEDTDGWMVGKGDFEYDKTEWLYRGRLDETCIRLDGSDLGSPNVRPNAWMYNKFTLGENDKFLKIRADGSENSDTNLRVRVIYIEDGEMVSVILSSESYGESELDAYGYYLLNGESPDEFVYDLSAYAGKTVVISIEQDDSGEGSGENIDIYEIKFASA